MIGKWRRRVQGTSDTVWPARHPWQFAGTFALVGASIVWVSFWLDGVTASESLEQAVVFASLWFVGRGTWVWHGSRRHHG